MNSIRLVVICSSLLAITSIAHAYDAETHALITYDAYRASVLAQTGAGSIVSELGLDRLDPHSTFTAYWLPSPTDPPYYDNTAVSPPQYPSLSEARLPNEYERCQMQNLARVNGYSNSDTMIDASDPNNPLVAYMPLQNWLMRGVLREDDVLPSDYKDSTCGQPDQDPFGAFRRVLGHFYDPIFDRPLTPYGVTCSSVPGLGTCWKSVDWALGYVDSFATPPVPDTNRRNHFTWLDARENMWLALTGERGLLTPPYTAAARNADAQERLFRWATTFRALGDAVHMLEDGAQPQHVRNDPHSPTGASPEQQAYEPYTNARVLAQFPNDVKGGLGGNYVKGFFSATAASSVRLPPIVTASAVSGSYPVPTFATPLRFYTTRLKGDPSTVNPSGRFGLIDYTNRGFFTAGSRPGYSPANNFSFPPTPVADGTNGYTAVKQSCVAGADIAGKVTNLKCLNFTHAVPDAVDPGYVDQLPPGFTAPPLLAESSFNIATTSFGVQHPSTEVAIGLDEFETMGNLTIPRAVAYSAGLIDYFFRGQIAITQPPAGIYAILDHSQTHTVDADGYPRDTNGNIFGFTQVQMNVLNATAPITESGSGVTVNQKMTNGQLVAVARYHRNKCYQPDLSGEISENYDTGQVYPPAGCDLTANRTPYQEISVSASLPVDANGNVTVGGQPFNLNGTTPILALFDFSADPIPINATDLFLQVVYRGNMGDTVNSMPMIEPDAIAVGTVDVSEPTYDAVFNEDYYLYQGQWLTAAQAQPLVPPGTDVNPSALVNVQDCIDDHLIGTKGLANQPAAGLQPARELRYAMILDIGSSHTRSDLAQFWVNGQPGQLLTILNLPVFLRNAQASMEQDPMTGPGAYAPNHLTWNRAVVMGDWTDFFYKGDGSSGTTAYPQNAPLPSGYLPDPPDAIYLNNPNFQVCNLGAARPASQPTGSTQNAGASSTGG